MVTSDVRWAELPFEINGLIDPISLTHTPSSFYELLQRDISRSERNRENLALITLDFSASTISAKKMIDLLMKISLILKQSLRSDEYFSRIGFEKFAILIHGDRSSALSILNRARKELKKVENNTFSIIFKTPSECKEENKEEYMEEKEVLEVYSDREMALGSSVEIMTQIFIRSMGMKLVEWLEVASI